MLDYSLHTINTSIKKRTCIQITYCRKTNVRLFAWSPPGRCSILSIPRHSWLTHPHKPFSPWADLPVGVVGGGTGTFTVTIDAGVLLTLRGGQPIWKYDLATVLWNNPDREKKCPSHITPLTRKYLKLATINWNMETKTNGVTKIGLVMWYVETLNPSTVILHCYFFVAGVPSTFTE